MPPQRLDDPGLPGQPRVHRGHLPQGPPVLVDRHLPQQVLVNVLELDLAGGGLAGQHACGGGPHGGVDFVPPAITDRLLIAGDETALPAIAGILERLADDARGEVLIEMPSSDDRIELVAPAGIVVRWLGRDGQTHGSLLVPAVRAAAARMLPGQAPAGPVELEDVDEDLLWEVPVDDDGRPLREMAAMYAWLAGEAGVIKTLRRHLVTECGVDRKAVAFMGYWRQGKAESA